LTGGADKAQGTRSVSWAENTGTGEKQEAAPRPRLFAPGAIKHLFGKLVEVLTGKPTPYIATARRKRREETGRAFRLTRILTDKVTRAIVGFMYSGSRYDAEAEREYAKQVLREQMEEWSQEDEQQQEGSFHYVSAAGFDPQP